MDALLHVGYTRIAHVVFQFAAASVTLYLPLKPSLSRDPTD